VAFSLWARSAEIINNSADQTTTVPKPVLEVDEPEFEDSTAHANSPRDGDLELSPQLEGPDNMMTRCRVVLTAG
jgi:hypothetical protein